MGSWLHTLWGGIKSIARPLLNLKGSHIWRELAGLYARLKTWFDWYRNHVHAHIQQMQALRRQIYAQFFQPILTIIDTIRRAAQVVGLISPKLAAKLNGIFLRIEDRILRPFAVLTDRFNAVSNVLRSTLTPLGYLDRATLVNSLWRDIAHVRELLRNPIGGVIPPQPLPPTRTTAQVVADMDRYFLAGTGRFAARLDAQTQRINNTMKDVR